MIGILIAVDRELFDITLFCNVIGFSTGGVICGGVAAGGVRSFAAAAAAAASASAAILTVLAQVSEMSVSKARWLD